MSARYRAFFISSIATLTFLFTFPRIPIFAQENQISFCIKNSGAAFVIGNNFYKSECNHKDKLFTINLNNPGIPGPQGNPGPAGKDGVSGWKKVSSEAKTRGTEQTVSTTCPDGRKVLSGGYIASSSAAYKNYYTLGNFPSSEDTWTVNVYRANSAESEWSLTVYAICANVL